MQEYPVVTVIGPRQAGKTTLVRECLSRYEYSNLEDPSVRSFAEEDPHAYLRQFSGNVIIDEIQRVPTLLSYIQIIVDETKRNGQFVLTGSHQLQLQEAVTQSLAGRTAILQLLPLSISELSKADISFDSFGEYCLAGFLPRVHGESVAPTRLYANYYQTYVERDVKLLISIKDLSLFEKFIKLVVGRVGQVMNYASLSNATGASVATVKNWLSTLEASFVVYKLPPYFDNFGKRLVKSPKYYFTDVGLLCFLLGIETPDQVHRDPLVGAIFENLVVLECLKSQLNQGKMSSLFFYRDSNGNEVDVIYQKGRSLVPVEVKSSATFATSFAKGVKKFQRVASTEEKGWIVYSGDFTPETDDYRVINFVDTRSIFDS